MTTRVAINGLGRIGRAVLKLVMDEPSFELVAVNDLVDAENLAYLLRFDTVYGRYSKPVVVEGDDLVVDKRKLQTFSNRDPSTLPWKELGVDLVFECTGAHTRREDLEKHVRAGARIVLLSAPSTDVEVVVHGANAPSGSSSIISCASCTTNCITPIVEVMGRRIGVRKAVMTTVHAYTSSQAIVDKPNKRFRRGRAAAANLVPTTTGAALATARALPEYEGRFDGIALRAPIPVGSIADITFVTSRQTTVDEVNRVFTEEADTERYAGVLGVSRDPLVSSDIIGDARASIIDLDLTRVVDGDLVKVMSWYDNEWGYANQMLREAISVSRAGGRMTDATTTASGSDLARGVPLSSIPDGGMLPGEANGESVLLARRGGDVFAISAFCTHYGAPLADGLLVDETVRCPWHHACFSLRTGQPLRAPALDPVDCWRVEQQDGSVYVREKLARAVPRERLPAAGTPDSVVIIGGGAAGNAAAETLRWEGYAGRITIVSADARGPCDRPNLSKGYLAGVAPSESNPLRSPEFYEAHRIDLKLGAGVDTIDTTKRIVRLADGSSHAYGALLLATGAEPIRLRVPGSDLPNVHYLRTLSDGEALVARAATSQRAVVIGASFIGLEVTASLRARDIAVQVIGREAIPMERILGKEVGTFIRQLHERHGVTFHLGTEVTSIDERGVTLESGQHLPADFVVIGIGVRPAIALAEQAGLAIDRGITVDQYLETSIPGVFAAGDIARWPDRLTGERIRVEHWVVAERQGQTAARNMLGRREPFDAVPFFWTEQYDFSLAYVGHAEGWDTAEMEGQLDADNHDCTITYSRDGRRLAVALVRRDLEGLRAEVEFERVMRGNHVDEPRVYRRIQ